MVTICQWKRDNPAKGHVYYWHELERAGGAPCSSGTIYSYWKSRGLISPVKKRPSKPPRETIATDHAGQLLPLDTSDKDGGTQWTIIDTYSRWQYSQWYAIPYPQITMQATLIFLEEAKGACPFIWEKVQMDNGREFQSSVQEWLTQSQIACQYTWANSPEQNGRVERSFRTDVEEFYRFFSPSQPTLEETQRAFARWNEHYNTRRLHSAVGWLPPVELTKCHIIS